jgi:hypothetical protein
VSDARYDKREAYRIAYQLRATGRIYRDIAQRAEPAKPAPTERGGVRWYSVARLDSVGGLSRSQHAARNGAVSEGAGHSLREIGSGWRSWALSEAGRSVVPADGEAAHGELGGDSGGFGFARDGAWPQTVGGWARLRRRALEASSSTSRTCSRATSGTSSSVNFSFGTCNR